MDETCPANPHGTEHYMLVLDKDTLKCLFCEQVAESLAGAETVELKGDYL